MALVTPAQVHSLLDVTVTEQHIAQAEVDVDIHGGVDLDDAAQLATLRARDLKLLRWAVIYQAAWRKEQIDLHARLDVIEISGSTSDGAIKARDELTLRLAPTCRSALERVSWKRRPSKRISAARSRAPMGPITTAAEIRISTDPVDTPDQLANALSDSGPYWAEVMPDRAR